jgi:hypothetical protein
MLEQSKASKYIDHELTQVIKELGLVWNRLSDVAAKLHEIDEPGQERELRELKKDVSFLNQRIQGIRGRFFI